MITSAKTAPGPPRTNLRQTGGANRAFLVLVAAALAQLLVTGARIIWASPVNLVGRNLADDAFYYFVIARNFPHIEENHGITTTGFHPLFWAVLVPIFKVFSGLTAVRASMLVLLVAHLLAGFMLYALLRRRWPGWTPALVATVWVASAELRTIVLLGVETALVEVALFALLLACDSRAKATPRRCAVVGASLGLAYLARNDALFVAVPVVLSWLWARRRDLGRGRLPVTLGPVAGVAALVAAPWVAFLARHGSLTSTDSARALALEPHRNVGLSKIVTAMATQVASAVGSFVADQGFVATKGQMWLMALALLLVFLGTVALRKRRWDPTEVALTLSVPLQFVLWAVVLRGIRPWYLVYAWVLLFVVLLPPLADACRALVRMALRRSLAWRNALTALTALALLVVVAAALLGPVSVPPESGDKFRAAQVAAPILGPHARVGSRNSGVYQFVLGGLDVENLDGVVNPRVQPYLRHQNLCLYFARQQLTWIIERAPLQLEVLAEAPGLRSLTTYTLLPPSHGRPRQVLVRVDPTKCG